jgi:hypothetical protein
MGLNEQFHQDPKHFAGLHTLYPYADKVTNAAHMKDLALANGDHFTQVGGENKVAFCDIAPASNFKYVRADMGGSYHQDEGLWVMRISYRRASSSSIPVYYLPWQENHMMRMKLYPSRKHPTKEGPFYWRTTVEPDIFVTAAVQGCSVFVSGEPEQPVVYHINAASVVGPQGETLAADNDTDYRAAAQAKAAHMTGLHQAAMAQFPKEGAKLPAGGRAALTNRARTAAAHLEDYLPDRLPSREPALVRLAPQGAQRLEVTQFGTIFGRRKDGTWRFYRQTRNRIDYQEQGQWISRWVNPVCVRFWP